MHLKAAVFCMAILLTLVKSHKDKDHEESLKDYKKVFFKKPDMRVNPFFGYNKYKVVKYTPPLLPPPPAPMMVPMANPVLSGGYTAEQAYADEPEPYQYQGQVPVIPASASYAAVPEAPYHETGVRSNYEMGLPSYNRYGEHAFTNQKPYPDISSFLKSSTI